MTTSLFPFLLNPALSDAGEISAAAKMVFYKTGTTSLATVYDANGNPISQAANGHGVVGVAADGFGRFPPIYLDITTIYRVRLMTAMGVQLGSDIDPVTGGFARGNGIVIANQAGTGNAVVIPNTDAYSGFGTATSGAPRTIWGTNAPSGDDACFLICRDVRGTSLFSHAIRDESTFTSNSDSAYTSFDVSAVINSNSGAKYNHSYGYEWRATFNAASGINVFAGFQTAPVLQQGAVDQLHHFRATNVSKSGGSIGEHAGFVCETLTGGTGTNFAFIARGNPSALLGDLQIAGHLIGVTDVTASGQFAAGNGSFTSTLSAYLTGGGVAVAGVRGGGGYGSLQAYNDNAGAARGLAINGNGGQVLVGVEVPTTGAALEVHGSFSCSGPVGFNGTAPPAKPTITGSRGGNAALTNLLLALQGMGLLTDSTSA